MNVLEETAKKLYEKTLSGLDKHGSITLSTCDLWRRGIYCSNQLESQAVPFVAEKFRKEGHRVIFSVNHKVEDYEIFPKVNI